ncbi:type II secretion system major pseudopilin GspG [Sphingomonas sp. BIUV-7]|uniref:Type II secretion system core protein G n=1 Tax=Sphingomonas natans TaxID=3063330 RepID=A0ABT8Y7E0_9SPHN|nr:type II secretion system major pseudopilin GspG [Sphingomonas sp. BIUV-7]MDO6413610.1 type II secretion system major pseudopilin GspG [Sphingomonas sp. BIUV-7]
MRMKPSGSATEVSHLAPNGEQGLTLVEMIVVLAIIALVAALIVPNIIGRPDQARVTVAQSDLRSISAALKMYRLDNGDYPTTAQGLAALVSKPGGEPAPRNYAAGAYLDKLPVDPWGDPYIYASPGADGAGFDLASNGKDAKPGGDGLAADIKLSSN